MPDKGSIVTLVELANHLSESVNAHYRDINDIDFIIEELNSKKKQIARLMQKDAKQLRLILSNQTFQDNVTEACRNDFAEALDGVDDLIEVQLCNIAE